MIVVPRFTPIVRRLVKWFYILFAIAVISLAVLVQAGRSFSHLLAKYPDDVSHYLSERLKANVQIGSLNAEWKGLKPMVDVHDLRITSQSAKPIIALDHAQMQLDLLGSLLHMRFVWSSLKVKQVNMEFIQTPDGFWHIPGLPRKGDDQAARLDPLLDMALLSSRIELEKTRLNFLFVSGQKTLLESPLVRMENDDDFHRLSLQIDVDKHPKTVTLIAESYGDPRQKKNFRSKGFVQFKRFPTTEPVAAVTALLLHGIKAEVHAEGSIDASLWFSSRKSGDGFDVSGNVGIQRLNLPIMDRKLALDSFASAVTGNWFYGGKWRLALQNIGANINQHHIQKVNFAASAEGYGTPVKFHMQRLDLQGVNRALDGAGVFGEGRLRDILRQLNARGELRNVELAVPPGKPADWQLRANLVQVGANAWQGVPQLEKVDGFLQAGQRGGHVDIDSRNGFSMHYSPTYTAAMEYQQARGQVAWSLQPEKNQIYVNSGALEFTNGDEKAKGYMWLSIPWKRNSGDIDLYLHVGAHDLPASLYTKYTPAVLPKSLLGWLEKGIGPENSGHVSQVGFLYRGTLNTRNRTARSHQLYLDVQHAQLNYHREWPRLENVSGRLLVNNENIGASVDSAKLFDSNVGPTEIDVRQNSAGEGSLLRVNGSVTGSASDGLRVLRESMLQRYLGSGMDSWKLTGELKTRVDIAVPLAQNAPGAMQKIEVDVNSPLFEIGNLRLAMRDVQGTIHYSHDKGIASEGLKARLFNEPVTAVLGTKKQGEVSQTIVDVKGDIESSALAAWSQRPEAFFLQGKVPYSAHIELNHGTRTTQETLSAPHAVITVTSNLQNISVNLPAPYGKSPNVERSLTFKMSLHKQTSLIDVTYGSDLQTLFELDARDSKLRNANIALGGNAKLASEPTFLLSGKLPNLDIEPWAKVQQRYVDYTAQVDMFTDKHADLAPKPVNMQTNDTYVAGLPFRANVTLDHYQVGPLDLKNIEVNAQRLIDGWKIQFSNPVVSGGVFVPNVKSRPFQINLDNLYLTRDILESKTADLSSHNSSAGNTGTTPSASKPAAAKKEDELQKLDGPTLDPRSLPLADISVKELYLDGNNYGSWSLKIRPDERGALFDDIHGSIRGITVAGADDAKAGAKMHWRLAEDGARTHFIGSLAATNMSDVLLQWNKPDMLDSTNANFRVDVSWGGDPQDFTLKNLTGTTTLWLEKGRFKRNPSAGSDGFLRLLAILNFDSIARRLRLDFSDLYKSGLAYDQINGKVKFEPGTMTFEEPLVVMTPSSRLQMAGQLDLNRERINTRLVATLPVAGNLTFVAALAAGLPAAAGIYLVSKLFKKQVDQATSVSYRIQGSWDDPKMNFDRLFESEENLRESVTEKKAANASRKRAKNPKARPAEKTESEAVEPNAAP